MHRRDLLLSESLDIHEPYRCTQLLRERVQGCSELVTKAPGVDEFVRQAEGGPLGQSGLERLVVQVGGRHLGTAPLRASPVEMGTHKDREQPGPRGRGVAQLALVLEGAQGGVLQQILGIRRMTGAQAQGGPKERVEVLAQELLKGAGLGTANADL